MLNILKAFDIFALQTVGNVMSSNFGYFTTFFHTKETNNIVLQNMFSSNNTGNNKF